MNIKKVYETFSSKLPAIVESILRKKYQLSDFEKDHTIANNSLVAHCGIIGSVKGDLAVFFENNHRDNVVKSFHEATSGEEDHGEKEICLEISNIILGHLTEIVRQSGHSINIMDLNTVSVVSDFSSEIPEFKQGKGVYISLTPKDQQQGMVTIWLNLVENESPDSNAAKSKGSVLIVDDSIVMRSFLEKVFTQNGYEVVGTAADGVEAIEKYETTKPDIMTLDIIMPKMKGTEALERIIAKYPEAKVLMASSVKDARTVMKCLKIGAKRYIIKPYDSEAVIEAVEKILKIE